MGEKKKITVTINGRNYTLRHDETDEYVHRIVQYLNNKVADVSRGGLQLGEHIALVMAAINITDELFKTQKNFNTLKNEIKRMMDEYDKLKLEKQELEKQYMQLSEDYEEANKKLLIKQIEFNEYRKSVEGK